jgi:hypothetical protein
MIFKPHSQSEERKRSAYRLVNLLLVAENRHEVLGEHCRKLLNTLLWAVTERDGKYTTRFRSADALASSGTSNLCHEHVFQREKMIDLLMAAKPVEIKGILEHAVGCVITREEHVRLKPFDNEYGWERYRKARIIVINTETGDAII